MNNTLRTSAVLLALSLTLTTGTALAAPATTSASGPQQSSNVPQAAASAGQQAFTIDINGTELTENGYLTPAGQEPLIPLRAIADALGFKLEWNDKNKSAELSQGNIFTTVKTGDDRYVINRMYTSLGTAPVLKDNKMYVPASFASEVLHQSFTVQGTSVLIRTAVQNQESVTDTGVITAIYGKDGHRSVQIQGAGTDGLVLIVSTDTTITSAEGTALAFTDLHIGMTVKAEHSIISTFSLPPQTPTYSITVLDQKKQGDLLGTAGTLEEVVKSEDGSLSITLKGDPLSETSQSEIVLRVGADTILVNGKGEAVESGSLVKGAKAIGFYGPMMTKSLPPIGTAVKVVVETAKP